ncbi:MAG: VWA domain-containing protein, partial [Kofleriaceae bacterium]|nr:VWA domain-containing protein [Kofleriaceae bacterium]
MVLDVSGSMSGEKLAQARQSVLDVVDQMRDDDRVALVTYSDSARVVQPLARVGDVRSRMHLTVPTIAVEGGTNIPSGLDLGAQTLAEAPATMVRRVVLMSDGRDGSNRDLETIAQDVRTKADQGVTLSSLGVGADYDERYMSRLADAGRGNYEFMRDGAQMRAFLSRELQQATRTTVERAVAEVTLPMGWRLTRAYGCEPVVNGRTVRL